jgi:hypothetical protein
MPVSTHVVVGGSAEATLRKALASVAPIDVVVGFRDPLDVGPVWDIDAGGEARAAFWEEVGLNAQWPVERRAEATAWAALKAARAPIVVWHGPHPTEYLLTLRVAAHLADDGTELHEVVRRRSTQRLPAFFGAVNLATVSELAALIDARVAMLDAPARATRWHSLCESTSAYFRDLTPDGVVELGADAHDDRILSACTEEWTSTARVLGTIMAELPVGDLVLAWRVRTLVARGRLAGRGQGALGVAEVRLAT